MRVPVAVLALLMFVFSEAAASAAERALSQADFRAVFPDATRFGEFSGTPPAATAYQGDRPAGYVFSTRAVVASVGYSGKPLDILAGVDLQGRITGARLLEHAEPILIIGITDADLERFLARLPGHDIRLRLEVERSLAASATQQTAIDQDAVQPGFVVEHRTHGEERNHALSDEAVAQHTCLRNVVDHEPESHR